MKFWQFGPCIEGWNRAHGGEEKPPPIGDEEFDAELRKFYG